ncbi:MAG: outer membrane beta-barrel protein [Methylophaga sp.]|nr:outer membrane beta-barrel protein [Methylophaga sp.]
MINKKILLALILAIYTQLSLAAEWSLTSALNPSVEYDDNVFLSENEQSSMHYAVTPTAVVTRAVDNMLTSLSVGYQIDRYTSLSSDNDTENPFIRFNSSYSTERSQYDLSASYQEATSRSTAVEDTGDFSTQSINRTRSISPSFSYQWTERDTLSFSGSYLERLSSTTSFADTETKSITAGWQHQFSERLSAGLNGTFSNYKSDGLTLSTDDDNYNLSTSMTYALSELWSLTGNVGARKLNSERTSTLTGITNDDTSTGSTFGFSAIRTDDINTYTINLSRDLSPSGTGDVNESDRINASWSHNISDRLTANMAASYQETTSALRDSNGKRKNVNFTPSLRWQLERNLNLNFKYSYRKQTQESGRSADSNAVSVTLNYNWDGIRISR